MTIKKNVKVHQTILNDLKLVLHKFSTLTLL